DPGDLSSLPCRARPTGIRSRSNPNHEAGEFGYPRSLEGLGDRHLPELRDLGRAGARLSCDVLEGECEVDIALRLPDHLVSGEEEAPHPDRHPGFLLELSNHRFLEALAGFDVPARDREPGPVDRPVDEN